MLKSLKNLIIVSLALILTASGTVSCIDVKLYKLKSIDPSNSVKVASNFYWDNAGTETNLFEQANGRTIILTFLGTWCSYCQRHLPELMKLYKYLPASEYYFINVFGEYNLQREDDIKTEIKMEQLEYDNVWYVFSEPTNMQLFDYYGVTDIMMTLIIKPNKKVAMELPDIVYPSGLDSINKIATGVKDCNRNPNVQISSNPVKGLSVLSYTISKPCTALLKVYNSLGAEIYNYSQAEIIIGKSGILFDGTPYDSGVYFYSLQLGSEVYNDKLLIVR